MPGDAGVDTKRLASLTGSGSGQPQAGTDADARAGPAATSTRRTTTARAGAPREGHGQQDVDTDAPPYYLADADLQSPLVHQLPQITQEIAKPSHQHSQRSTANEHLQPDQRAAAFIRSGQSNPANIASSASQGPPAGGPSRSQQHPTDGGSTLPRPRRGDPVDAEYDQEAKDGSVIEPTLTSKRVADLGGTVDERAVTKLEDELER